MSEINIVAWNSRGCNSDPRVRHITDFVHKHKVSTIGILETKILREKENEISRKLLPGWQFCTNSDVGVRGRIWLSWDQSVLEVIIIRIETQFIHCRVVHNDNI